MPRTKFEGTLTVENGKVVAHGPVPGQGNAEIIHIHWLVEQSGTIATGVIQAHNGQWHDTAHDATAWKPGNATAVGLAVSMTPDGPETFAWMQTVRLQII